MICFCMLFLFVAFTIFDNKIHRAVDEWFLKNFINEEKYPNMEKRKIRCYTLTKWVTSQLYYFPIAIWGYLIFKQTSLCPPFLGGTGSCFNLLTYITRFDEATIEMKAYYMIQLGKHVSRFFTHIFIRAQGNFYEYSLHHGLSTFLIVFSYLSNMWLLGILVLILHDFTDIWLILSRSTRDYKNKKQYMIYFCDIMLFPSWVGCRVFIFSYCCVYSSFYAWFQFAFSGKFQEKYSQVFYYPYLFMSIMLFLLEIMQLFWTYYIAASVVSFNITSKVKHTYD